MYSTSWENPPLPEKNVAARRVQFPTIQIKRLDVLTSDGRFLREKDILLEPANPTFSLKKGDWR